ncbi:hypothetical protein M422DRAFT_50356 [Sphaerobolus stellatus SS14]|uniref:NAD-dependent epimerase/dehydratase domain-containing protein n=1 Tax=Sphaerobolus stellatus (strain SS14) TaxID=990650 RepID=A0A0C9VIZ8_SPHS4|nr:hypothetical protein M422DRAFT_50356 [Sphaerobolus stellatus SS14]
MNDGRIHPDTSPGPRMGIEVILPTFNARLKANAISNASKQLILFTSQPNLALLVTGASGFVGAQAVQHLLGVGTSRSGKAEELNKPVPHPDFQVVVVDDFIKGDLSEALKGVHAVIHAASSMLRGSNHIEVGGRRSFYAAIPSDAEMQDTTRIIDESCAFR